LAWHRESLSRKSSGVFGGPTKPRPIPLGRRIRLPSHVRRPFRIHPRPFLRFPDSHRPFHGRKSSDAIRLKSSGCSAKIIIVDIAPKYYPVHHTSILEGLNSLDLKTLESRQAANDHLKRFEEKEGVRQFLLKNLYRNADQEFAWRINLKVITQHIDVVGHELWVKNPSLTETIFIKGADSYYIQPEDHRYIAEIFPNFELIEIPHAGHWVQADQPEAFLAALNQVL